MTQPRVPIRVALAACMIYGATIVIPPTRNVQARGMMGARVVPAGRWTAQARGASPHGRFVQSPTLAARAAGSVLLTPPIASGAAPRLYAARSVSRASRRLFALGLLMPKRAITARAPVTSPGGTVRHVSLSSAPPSMDLSSYDPAVGNQGPVNSCASWATGYTLLGWYANRYGISGAPYAPMYVYSQVTGGQNVGTTFEANFSVEQQQGIDTQSDYIQGNYDYRDQPTAAERANAAGHRVTGYTPIYAQGAGSAQQAIEAAMSAGQPVVVGIPVYSNFMYATAAAPLVDVPPAGSTLFGGHAVVGVKYDATGLWIQNQWGTSWALNGYAELSWAFVNQYLWSAYTISGFQGANTAGPTATAPAGPTATPGPSTPTATPVAGAQLSVSPASGLPGTSLTISGSGFGAGTVSVYWNGSLITQVFAGGGTFSLPATLSLSAAPGPRAIKAVSATTGAQATTTFMVLSSLPTATATTTPVRPTATATATATPAAPTATATPAAPTQTPTAAPAGTAALSVNPGAAVPGSTVMIGGSGFRGGETISLYWNGIPFTQLYASSSGTFSFATWLSPTTPVGTRTVTARGSSGDQASATLTVLGAGGATATASPIATQPSQATPVTTAQATATPSSAPTQPAASPTPAGIPTSGTTGNGCQITSLSGQAEAQLLATLNTHRDAAGVAELTLNPSLSAIARTHSCDMFLHQQLSHTGSDGSTPFQRMAAGGFPMPPYGQEGENIGDAYGMAPGDAVTIIDNSMMAEPLTYGDHHWNIVNGGYKTVGLGVIAANGQTWVTEDFAG